MSDIDVHFMRLGRGAKLKIFSTEEQAMIVAHEEPDTQNCYGVALKGSSCTGQFC